MIPIIEDLPRSDEYDEYLENHISNVIRSYNEILRPVLLAEVDTDTINSIDRAVNSHDESKYDMEEYIPYLRHFYPTDDIDPDSHDEMLAYNYAWLRHIRMNPHHWQHWVLIHDEGNIDPMDMPLCDVISMLCDWHSFSASNPESTAYKWYNDNGKDMLLSDGTRKIIDKYIKYLKDPLT